jgi:hypothetical protein
LEEDKGNWRTEDGTVRRGIKNRRNSLHPRISPTAASPVLTCLQWPRYRQGQEEQVEPGFRVREGDYKSWGKDCVKSMPVSNIVFWGTIQKASITIHNYQRVQTTHVTTNR